MAGVLCYVVHLRVMLVLCALCESCREWQVGFISFFQVSANSSCLYDSVIGCYVVHAVGGR